VTTGSRRRGRSRHPYAQGVRERRDTTTARRVYEASAVRYVRGVGTRISAVTETADDRRLLTDLLRAADHRDLLERHPGRGPVADLGCGPGRVAAMCHELGVDAVGVDMSVTMLRMGRGAHGSIPFVAGYLSCLPFASGSFRAAVLWYSIIHAPPADLATLFAEVRRVVTAGSPLVVAFQAGDGRAVSRSDAYDSGITLTSRRHEPGVVATTLNESGFEVRAVEVRPPALAHETDPQAFVLATAVDASRC
jgi:SAM-dependent methyltransferase